MSRDTSAWNAIMQYSFLHAFANDGTIDAGELAMLERLAMRDGEVDEQERNILARVFAKVGPDTVTAEVWEGITQFKQKHAIP